MGSLKQTIKNVLVLGLESPLYLLKILGTIKHCNHRNTFHFTSKHFCQLWSSYELITFQVHNKCSKKGEPLTHKTPVITESTKIQLHLHSEGSKEQLKARGQDAQIKFLAKLNIVKTTPNFACEFVYVC